MIGMKNFFKAVKWLIIVSFSIATLFILYLRVSRFTDKMIYQTTGFDYENFESDLNFEQLFFNVEDSVSIHGVLFKPDTSAVIATIFHYSGQGMHLNSSMQKGYKPLLNKGFQIFNFERRDFGKSNGKATNTITLKEDALFIFDKIITMENVADKPVIIWGQSLGGTFATMTANERQEKISGLILEGTFASFPDIGKFYARALHLENFKWIVPLIMHNDFPVEEEIKKITLPTVIIHSKTDAQVPYQLGRKIFEASNKGNTTFWDIDSKHIMGIYDFEDKYVEAFIKMVRK